MNKKSLRETFRQRIRNRIEDQLQEKRNSKSVTKIREGQIFLMTEPQCPSCMVMKSKKWVEKKINNGEIIVLEDNTDPLRLKIEREVKLKSVPSFVVYLNPYGFQIAHFEDDNGGECEQCKSSVGVNMALSICKELGYDDCDSLHKMAKNDKIDPDEILDLLIERTEGLKEQEHLIEIKEQLH